MSSATVMTCRKCGGTLGSSYLYTTDGFSYHHACFPVVPRDAEIARLKEQLAAQIDGHQLTAKEATANLLRANRIEAGLKEMTRSCLAERAGRLAAEAERGRLREALREAHYFLLAPAEDLKDGVLSRISAALQKEPKP